MAMLKLPKQRRGLDVLIEATARFLKGILHSRWVLRFTEYSSVQAAR
jgi:hypothetical protein